MKFMSIIYSSYFRYVLSLGSALLSTSIYKVRSVSNGLTLFKKLPVRFFDGITKFLTKTFVVFLSPA